VLDEYTLADLAGRNPVLARVLTTSWWR